MVPMGTRRPRRGSRLCRRCALPRRGDMPRPRQILRATKYDKLSDPLLEAEDMPVDFLPGDVLPGHHQGLTLCFGALPLTHRFTFQNTGPTSAYPGCYSW